MKIMYETDRLIIRKWQKRDFKDLYEYASDNDVTKFLHFETYSNENIAKDRIDKLIESYKTNSLINNFAIMLKSSKKVIGDVNISTFKPQAGGSVHIGYTLNKKYQGLGYATEAVFGALKFIKKNNIAKRIEATHDIENSKSGNVLKRVGMTFEGVLRKAGENNYHSRYDVALYSILYEEIED